MKIRLTAVRPSDAAAGTEDSSRGAALGRGVGIFVSVVVVSAAGLLGLAAWAGNPQPVGTPQEGVVLDAWNVLYDTAAP